MQNVNEYKELSELKDLKYLNVPSDIDKSNQRHVGSWSPNGSVGVFGLLIDIRRRIIHLLRFLGLCIVSTKPLELGVLLEMEERSRGKILN
ncbi:unnamed protein product [Caenorhabditis nigoni]